MELANHYRGEILLLIGERDGITLEEIGKALSANEAMVDEHTRSFFQAGLLNKS